MTTPRDIKKEVVITLLAGGIQNPSFEADLMLSHFLTLSKADLLKNDEIKPNEKSIAALFAAVKKRCGGYPLQYILGTWEFFGFPFYVDESVLIPRADTETLVEAVLEKVAAKDDLVILDLCCGSGCIGIALTKKLNTKQTIFLDISQSALKTAKKNAGLNGVLDRCQFICCDIFSSPLLLQTKVDGIVCNPPYLTYEDMVHLQTEVSFEPKEALFGGDDGLMFYRVIPPRVKDLLKPGGFLFFECGQEQDSAVSALLSEAGFCDITVKKDLNGISRVVYGKLTG